MKGDIAHICNRGVEKRRIFLDKQDYKRFVDNLFLLNNVGGKIRTKKKDIFNDPKLKQDKLVEILKWSLLPNHFHLLLYEVVEGGISEFTRRVGNAYTKYFNTKNQGRNGYLFQNGSKIILIENDSHFQYIPFYIDLNPVQSFLKTQKPAPLIAEKVQTFLRSYEWSSFKDFFGDGQRIAIVNQNLFYDLFDTNLKTYRKELLEFMKDSWVSTWHVDTFG